MPILPEELVDGNIYWSTQPDIESLNHEDTQPRRPWRGKLATSHSTMYLCRFNPQTGEMDDDTNAKALVGNQNTPTSYANTIFLTYEEAREAYLHQIFSYLMGKIGELSFVVEEAKDVLTTVTTPTA